MKRLVYPLVVEFPCPRSSTRWSGQRASVSSVSPEIHKIDKKSLSKLAFEHLSRERWLLKCIPTCSILLKKSITHMCSYRLTQLWGVLCYINSVPVPRSRGYLKKNIVIHSEIHQGETFAAHKQRPWNLWCKDLPLNDPQPSRRPYRVSPLRHRRNPSHCQRTYW